MENHQVNIEFVNDYRQLKYRYSPKKPFLQEGKAVYFFPLRYHQARTPAPARASHIRISNLS